VAQCTAGASVLTLTLEAEVAESIARINRARVFRLHTIVFLLSLGVFLMAPVVEVSDSRYAVMLSESLWRHGTPDLDKHYHLPAPGPHGSSGQPNEANKYQLIEARGHVTYFFPHGTSILSIPLVAAINTTTGVSAARPDGRLNLDGELRIGRWVSAVLMAALTCVFFATAMMMLPVWWSMVVALGASFGSQILSTATRGLWSHDWEILLYGLMAYSILNTEHRGARFRPLWIATLVAWVYFVRPTGVVAIVAVSAYVWWRYRKNFIAYAAALAGWGVAFAAYWWWVFASILPPYFVATRMRTGSFVQGLAGNLIDPGRGLFVYVPATIFVLYLIGRYWSQLQYRPLAILALAQIMGIELIIANYLRASGYCYGPRYFTDALPWFVLLAILGLDAMRHAPSASSHRTEIVAALLLLAVSVAMNARGAWSFDALDWSMGDFAQSNPSIFDWRYPQFMAGLIKPPN
jgi:hypothetical protein